MDENKERIRMLVVDDEVAIADILKDYLSEAERSVDVCYSGVDAIENIQKKTYDIIIVDLVMPKVGGLDVLRYAKKINPAIILIIFTSHASLETAITAIKEGAYDYIRKPCKLEEIKIVVDNAVDKITMYRENKRLLSKLQSVYSELMDIKQAREKHAPVERINFISSNMPNLNYFFKNETVADNYVDKLQALVTLKENGNLTENEFQTFKNTLLKVANRREPGR